MAVKTFTTGEVLTSADTNTYLANSGLVYVTSAAIGSGVSTVTISNCFNSSYDAYQVVINNVDGSASTSALVFQLVDSGGTAATTNYKMAGIYMTYASGAVNGVNTTDWQCSLSATNFGGSLNIFNPFLSVASYYDCNSADDSYIRFLAGTHTTAASYVSLKIFPNGGTMSGGTIAIYGYRKA